MTKPPRWTIERAVPGVPPGTPGPLALDSLDMLWETQPDRYGVHARPVDAMRAFLAAADPDIDWRAHPDDYVRRHWRKACLTFGCRLGRVRLSAPQQAPAKTPGNPPSRKGSTKARGGRPEGSGMDSGKRPAPVGDGPDGSESPESSGGGSLSSTPLPRELALPAPRRPVQLDLLGALLPRAARSSAMEALATIEGIVDAGRQRMRLADPITRGLRPAELDWLEPSELAALQAHQDDLRRLVGPALGREAARGRVAVARALRRAAASQATHAGTCDMGGDCDCEPLPPLTPALRRALDIVAENGGKPEGLGVSPAVLASRLWPSWPAWSPSERRKRKARALTARAAGVLAKLTRMGYLGPAVFGSRLLRPLKT